MNILEAAIKDALENGGCYDPDEVTISEIAVAVEDCLRDEGWIDPIEANRLWEALRDRA